jgi:hypothetical protein
VEKIVALADEARQERIEEKRELEKPNFPYSPDEFYWNEDCRRFRMLEEKIDEVKNESRDENDL